MTTKATSNSKAIARGGLLLCYCQPRPSIDCDKPLAAWATLCPSTARRILVSCQRRYYRQPALQWLARELSRILDW